MKVSCDRCGEELAVPGGILLGPPEEDGRVRKRHLCRACYWTLSSWIDKAVSSDG